MVVPVLLFAVSFLILLAVILCISIIRKRYKMNEELEELEVVEEDMENMQLMELEELRMISPLANAISGDVASGETAPDEAVFVDVASSEAAFDKAVVLEDIAAGGANKVSASSLFWRPFATFPHNPELLESWKEMPEVIYEQDGIHYIKKNYSIDKNTEGKLDSNFMKLVESVVGKT